MDNFFWELVYDREVGKVRQGRQEERGCDGCGIFSISC